METIGKYRHIIYVILLGALIAGFYLISKNTGQKMAETFIGNQKKEILQEKDLLLEEIECLKLELQEERALDKTKIIYAAKLKEKYNTLYERYSSLQLEMASIRNIVLPYAALDSLAGVVQYPQE